MISVGSSFISLETSAFRVCSLALMSLMEVGKDFRPLMDELAWCVNSFLLLLYCRISR